MANALAYYDTAIITFAKSFKIETPGVDVIKLFTIEFTSFHNKLERFVLGHLFKPTLTNTLDY
jgi:hypothetical protein